jgi:hypothetical protein
MGNEKHSPILPIPYWFHQVLMEEKLTVAKVVWFFLNKSLEQGKNEISCSVSRLARIIRSSSVHTAFEALKEAMSKGYIKRVSEGYVKNGKMKAAVYKVNWNFLEDGTENRVRKTYQYILRKWHTNPRAITDDADKSDKILRATLNANRVIKAAKPKMSFEDIEKVATRSGRFGAAFENEDWKVKQDDYIKRVMAKINQGNTTALTPAELWRYFQFKYQTHYRVKYLGNMGVELFLIKKMMAEGVTQRDFVQMTDWLMSGQNQFESPTIKLLSTNWRQKIYTESQKSAKIRQIPRRAILS